MTSKEFFDIGRVAYITGNVQEALAAKQALEKVVESANNLQQLKTKIAALADIVQDDINGGGETDRRWVVERLRQLSAV